MWAARNAGLKIDDQRLRDLLKLPPPTAQAWAEQKHESLTWKWWPAELLPKFRRSEGKVSRLPSLGLGRRRELKEGALIDRAALLRIRELSLAYEPPNLCRSFIDTVRSLTVVPEHLPYSCDRNGQLPAAGV